MTKLKIAYSIVFGVLLILFVGFMYLPPIQDDPIRAVAAVDSSAVRVDSTEIIAKPTTTVEIQTPDNPHLQSVINSYHDFMQQAIARGVAPGAAVAIVYDTSVIFLKGFGLKQSGTADSIDVHTVFRLGSVSKCFASILAGTLVSDQLINWDDPVLKYYPQFQLISPEHTSKVTIRHVLSHTTGLPYHAYTNMIEEHLPLDTLLASLKTVKLFGEPGQIYSYQNVGYSLIEKVVEQATHQTFERALTENVFKPLGMYSSSASYLAIMNHDNVAKPHYFARKRWTPVPISDTYYNVSPAGGVNASIADMALWLRALLQHDENLMADTTLNEIFTPQVKAISKNRNFNRWKRPRSSYYALGWRVINFKNDQLLYHGGYVNGYRSEVAIDQKNKIAICVLTNSPGNLADLSVPEFFKRYSLKADSIQYWQNQHNPVFVKHTNPASPISHQ
ncbi:MAG: class A beta-lactamase-related serine hydrolase [Cyclobacteriaceae bacterium]|nr:MAG: class A beta-lactamase-related serine hydrolase [Cyclobacteriaceae bacterium]